jgi:hypothetical protein
MPIQDSFHIVVRALQTGFPDPAQYVGFALTQQLLPKLPHELAKKKQMIAKTLLPGGISHQKAKQLLQRRYELFVERKAELLAPVEQLMCSFSDNPQQVAAFFSYLQTSKNPLEELAGAQKMALQAFLLDPLEAFEKKSLFSYTANQSHIIHEMIEQKELQLRHRCQHAAHTEEAKKEQAKLAYILSLRPFFEKAASEKPSQKIAALALRQLEFFIRELEDNPSKEELFERIQKELVSLVY